MVGQHPLAYGAPHGFHQLSCVVTSSRIDRHNNRTYVLKKHLDMTKIYSSAASYNLHASSVSRKQVDLQLDSTFHQPMSLSVDTTISVAFLPTHLASVASSATALYNTRAAEKIAKHAAGCAEQSRSFLPFVGDTGGGIGPAAFTYWLRDVYSADQRRQRADGDDGSASRFALEHLLRELLAVLVRDNFKMIDRLVRDR